MLKYGSGYMLISVNENDFKDKVNIILQRELVGLRTKS